MLVASFFTAVRVVMTDAAGISENKVNFYQTTRRYTPEESPSERYSAQKIL
jgi:hypothetical protein